jgi:hypothetical protein
LKSQLFPQSTPLLTAGITPRQGRPGLLPGQYRLSAPLSARAHGLQACPGLTEPASGTQPHRGRQQTGPHGRFPAHCGWGVGVRGVQPRSQSLSGPARCSPASKAPSPSHTCPMLITRPQVPQWVTLTQNLTSCTWSLQNLANQLSSGGPDRTSNWGRGCCRAQRERDDGEDCSGEDACDHGDEDKDEDD